MKRNSCIYLLSNLCLLILAGLFRLYAHFAEKGLIFCLFKLFFKGYCAFCGGTRALSSILTLRLWDAFCSNAFVTLCVFLLGGYDLCCGIRLLKKDPHPFRFSSRIWWAILAFGIAFFVGRNLLLWCADVDMLGDFFERMTNHEFYCYCQCH